VVKVPTEQEQFDSGEAKRRTEAALRAAFSTPHKTYEESKVGKSSAKRSKSPKTLTPSEREQLLRADKETSDYARKAFSTPHKTYEQSKVGKKRGSAKAKPRPASREKRDNRR
jgi:hypothetical protein